MKCEIALLLPGHIVHRKNRQTLFLGLIYRVGKQRLLICYPIVSPRRAELPQCRLLRQNQSTYHHQMLAVVQIFSLSLPYSRGKIFAKAAIHRLRNFALMLILLAICDPFCYFGALGYTHHLQKIVEGVEVSLDLDALSDSVEIIFAGLIFLVISKIMAEAVRLEEEVR